MDKDTLEAEIASFIQSKDVDEKTKDKMTSRLRESIHFMADLGVSIFDTPSKALYDRLNEYLHTLIQPRGKNKGQHFSDSVIRDWKNLTEKFYNRNGKRSDDSVQLVIAEAESIEATPASTERESITADTDRGAQHAHTDTQKGEPNMTTENSAVSAETLPVPTQPEAQPQAPSTVEASRKPGRPETTGRSEKFTLYMTPELWKKITMLADLDEVKITDLMNDALEYYCENERSDDLAFLYTLERRKQERRLQKARS